VNVEATMRGPLDTDADTIVVGLVADEQIAHDVPDRALGALLESGEARTEPGALAVTHAAGRRFVLVGLGERSGIDAETARVAAAKAHGRARELGAGVLCWELPHHVPDEIAAALVEGTLLHAYRFDRYRPRADGRGPARLLISAHHDVSAAVGTASIVVAAQNRARDLANTPANDLTPSALADHARATAQRLEGVEAEVMDEAEIREAGMGAFAAVAQGSAEPARLITLRYEGPDARGPLIGLVGKAVTFDTGGLSLKPPAKMHEMKFDMAGGAAVIEAIAALAELAAPVRIVGVVGATENMPGGTAVKPGDIVRAQDRTTIEVNNTDAEGRLVLADCLLHARAQGAQRLIDVATLTGGVVAALGSVYAGLLANDEALASLVQACGRSSGDLVWRLPLHEAYAAMVKGRYAELTNLSERREASTITGAEFLHHFAGATPWAHIDIAGTADNVSRAYYAGKGATGFGVRLLVAVSRAVGSDPDHSEQAPE
jgi:leucyl aminopeptidase